MTFFIEFNQDIEIAAFVLLAAHKRAKDAELANPLRQNHFGLVLFEDRFCFLDISYRLFHCPMLSGLFCIW